MALSITAVQAETHTLIDRAVEIVKKLRDDLEHRDVIYKFDFRTLDKVYGRVRFEEMLLVLWTYVDSVKKPQPQAAEPNGEPRIEKEELTERTEAVIRDLCDRSINRYLNMKELIEDLERSKRRDGAAARLIPSADVAERFIRYEAHLSREFDRIMSHLERLQSVRRGQSVPPSGKVEVSS